MENLADIGPPRLSGYASPIRDVSDTAKIVFTSAQDNSSLDPACEFSTAVFVIGA